MSDSDPPASARGLVRKLAALPEPAMREAVLREYLTTTDVEESVATLTEVIRAGRSGGPQFHIALSTVAGLLSRQPEQVPYVAMAQLYTEAKASGYEHIAQLFLTSKSADDLPAVPDVEYEQTLGHRKALARLPNRDSLEQLLRNPEVEVVPHILQNPRLLERDVVLLAARRPTVAEMQRLIFTSKRWVNRHRVKRALLFNPHTPVDIAIRLLGFFDVVDLRRASRNKALDEVVRDAAVRMLSVRTSGGLSMNAQPAIAPSADDDLEDSGAT